MKKVITLLIAALVAVTTFAQTNLAKDKTSIATSGNAYEGNDGNTGSRWESAQGVDPQSWQVDLGEATNFNAIQIVWEGAYAKTFQVLGGNTVGEDGFITDGVVLASFTGQTLKNFPYYQVIYLDEAVSYRYVQFLGTERGTVYGYSFWEFGVYNLEASQIGALGSMKLTAAATETTLGTPVALTVNSYDLLGGEIANGEISYTVGTPAVGAVENGQFVPAAAGTTTIKAVCGDIESNEVSITVAAGQKIDLFTNYDVRVYNLGLATNNSKVGAFDDNDGSVWAFLGRETGADEASRTYDVGFIADLRGIYDINQISIHFEGACSEAFTLAFAGEDGVFGEAVYTGGAAGINNHTETFSGQSVTNARYVKFFSTKASTQWDVKIFDFSVYGTLKSAVTDTEAPAISAIAATGSDDAVTLTVTATDNSSKYIAYEVNGTMYALGTSKAGEANEVVISGLNGGTSYEFSVVAIDAFGNRSEAATVAASTTGAAFVLTAAPTPTVDAENVKSLYSNAYTAATTYGYGGWGQATVTGTETVEGDEMIHLTNYNYLGFEFANDIDLSDMEYIHIDILPRQAMSFGITPIMRNAPTENSTLVGDLTVDEWNSIDMPLSQLNLVYTDNTAFQLKIDRGTGVEELYIDNIYFYKSAGEEPVEPTEGQVLTADGHTVVLNGYHYTDTDNYELIITSQETMVGLGGSFWHINGNEGKDLRENIEVSADGHTITVTAVSTSEPQLYTPLYVLMPGEVNFGLVTIDWKEKGGEEPSEGVTAITIDASASEIEAGKTLHLSVKDQNGNAVTEGLTFATSDEEVATVDAAGLVTAVAEGNVTITATYVAPTEMPSGAPIKAAGEPITAEIELTVTPAAQPGEGQVLTADGHTVTLVGRHYTDTDSSELYSTSDEQMVGLGGSFWHINGNETSDLRTNIEISEDGHTIICSTQSTSEPQLYTPLYVLMPGEVNFGTVVIEWIEVGSTVGVTTVKADTNKGFNVYTIDGRVLQHGGETLIDLPAGLYIINGKKVIVK